MDFKDKDNEETMTKPEPADSRGQQERHFISSLNESTTRNEVKETNYPDESQKSYDTSLSSAQKNVKHETDQETQKSCNETDQETQKSCNSDDINDKFEEASISIPAEELPQEFKNSFYEKLSVTCQNLGSTVASLKKSQESLDQCVDIKNEITSKTSEVVPEIDNTILRPVSLPLPIPRNISSESQKNHDKILLLSKEVQMTHANSPTTAGADRENTNKEEVLGAHYIEPSNSSPSVRQGLFTRKGDMIEFVADNLEQKIKQSSPLLHADNNGSHGSRRSSVHSTASGSSSTSFATSSGASRSHSSLLQQSPGDIPPIDAAAVHELENHALRVADSLNLMMGNIRNNLHKMSAITIGCQDAYKRSVDITCDSVDGSIKTMYALMAKCEELSQSMGPVNHLAAQIKEIKRILDLFELQLNEKDK